MVCAEQKAPETTRKAASQAASLRLDCPVEQGGASRRSKSAQRVGARAARSYQAAHLQVEP
jgi:hypothetical protein